MIAFLMAVNSVLAVQNGALLELTGEAPMIKFDGALTLVHNATEDKLACSGEFEAADVRIAGTTTTVAELILKVGSLESDVAALKQFVGMMPPPASPSPEMPPPSSPPPLPPRPPPSPSLPFPPHAPPSDPPQACALQAQSKGWYDRGSTYARVLSNSVQFANSGGGGFNVWKADPSSCTITSVDLGMNPYLNCASASTRLYNALSAFTPGEIVLVAVADTPSKSYSNCMSAASISQLQSFGARVSGFGWRNSYCLIGRKNSPSVLSELLPTNAPLSCAAEV